MDFIFPHAQVHEYLNRIPKDINLIVFKYVYGEDYEIHLDAFNIRILDRKGNPVCGNLIKQYLDGNTYSYYDIRSIITTLVDLCIPCLKHNIDTKNRKKLFIIIMYIVLFKTKYTLVPMPFVNNFMTTIIDRINHNRSHINPKYSNCFMKMARYFRSHTIFQKTIN